MHDIRSSLIVSMCMYVPSYSRGEREYMMCINTYSLVKRVCVGHELYILSSLVRHVRNQRT